MEQFEGRIAVVTGGGSGMGRELVRQLAAAGATVATCDVDPETLEETRSLALADAPDGVRVVTGLADVSDEAQLVAFRDATLAELGTDHVHLLFNNAGIGGGGSFITDPREQWEKTFSVTWGGVYLSTRVFLPLLIAAPDAHLINTSSINGFWAYLGPNVPHTAYSAAKFAVKGFSEALITDLGMHAPHVRVSVVMPGHVGTAIMINSSRAHGADPKELTEDQLTQIRERSGRAGLDLSEVGDEDLKLALQARAEAFRDNAPLSASGAATIILDGVRANRWRILVGEDAMLIDEQVRATPEQAYELPFLMRLVEQGVFGGMAGN